MRVDSCNNSPSFKGCLNNKMLLRGLEAISDHGASFIAGTSFVMGACVRPLVIHSTPNIEKENKQYAEANAFCSGLIKFIMAEAVALPIEGAVKKIGENPDKFLKKETVDNLKTAGKSLLESRDYKFATQFMKLSAGMLTAIPKSMLTIALIPIVMDNILGLKKKKAEPEIKKYTYDPVFEPVYNKTSFKGLNGEKVAKGLGKILDINSVQSLAKKHSINDVNIARNMSVATDLLLTASTVISTKKSDKIKEERKNPLIYNSIISTGASIIGGCAVDKLAQKAGSSLIEKFKEVNKNDPKLLKYLEGINILRPTLIFALIYYGILPAVSTFAADKTDKFVKGRKQQS